MGYQALYRKYRPRHFSEVIGQEPIVRTLLNSVKQDKIGHAYLFSGPRGTGKTTIARILARAINCGHAQSGEPCDECPRCRGAEEGLGVLEIDAASHGSVDDMRLLVAQVSQIPLSGGMMVYIIDEVHMLSKEAFNAFLKTLEEPPPHAVFVLATTEPGKLLPTIHSRCQHFAFRRVPIETVSEHIAGLCQKENIPADPAAVRIIARTGDGSIRDSISVLEQAIAFEPNGLTLEGVRQVLGIPDRVDIRRLGGDIISANPGDVAVSFADLVEMGREPGEILKALLAHFRDVLFASLEIQNSDLDTLPNEELELVSEQAGHLNSAAIHRIIAFLAKIDAEMKWEDEAALILESALLRLADGFTGESDVDEVREVSDIHHRSTTRPETPKQTRRERTESSVTSPEPPPDQEPVKPSGVPSLTGGRTIGRKKAPSETVAPNFSLPKSEQVSAASLSEELGLKIPENVESFWKNALESVLEESIHEYILLAEAEPSPPPSQWPKIESESKELLNLTLKYPSGSGLVVKLVNEPLLLGRLTSRLSEVLERPVQLQIRRERGVESSDCGDQADAADSGNSANPDGPALFKGAGRPVPSDPNLKQIHNLIVDDFPEYRVQYYGPVDK